MRGVNKVIIVGRLGQDPDVRYTQSGDAVATLSVATSESWKGQQGQQQEKTEWHRIVFWKRQAEICDEYLKKGSAIYVEGKLQTRKWQDQQGQDRYTTEIKGIVLQMLGDSSGSGSSQQGNTMNPDGTPKSPEQMKQDGYMKQPQRGKMSEPDFDFDDDIPF